MTGPAHPQVPRPADHPACAARAADRLAGAFGSMRMFGALVTWQAVWIVGATLGAPLLARDPYPFAFLLFCSNLVQLWALPVLGAATNRAEQRRAVKAATDHQALTHIAVTVDQVLAAVQQPGRLPPRPGRR